MFTSMASSNEPDEAPQVVSLRVIAEERRIAAIMRGGDVVMVSIDEEDAPAEVEGTFESGILAASWSPDESLLVLVTGDQKLILMTPNFDALSEGPVHPSEFGEGEARCLAKFMPVLIFSRRTNKRWLGFQADPVPWIAREKRCSSAYQR